MKNKYEPTYWNSKGKFQKEYKFIHEHFIPSKGNCELMKAELARCISNIYYDIYNNGGCNLDNYKYEICFIDKYLPEQVKENWKNILNNFKEWEDNYENNIEFTDKFMKDLDLIVDAIIDKIFSFLTIEYFCTS